MGHTNGRRDRQTVSQILLRILRGQYQQEAQLSPTDRAMRRVSRNHANCHATVQKLLVRQVLNQVSAVAN